MKIKLTLLTSARITKKGYPIVVSAHHNGKTQRFTFGLYAEKEHWDPVYNVPNALHQDYQFLYPKILDLKYMVREINYKDETSFTRVEYFLKGDKTATDDFYYFADKLIQEKKNANKHSTAKTYNTAIIQLKMYAKQLEFEQINHQFLVGFKNYKIANNVSNTSIHTYLRRIRTIYNEAIARGVIKDKNPFKTIFRGLAVRANRTKKKYLEIEDIYKLEKIELSGNRGMVRDLFLLQFYFGGQDLIDIYNLKTKDIVNGRVYFNRTKLQDRGMEFDLKVPEKAAKILDKYIGPVDVFKGRKDWQGYQNFRRRYTVKLLEIQKLCKIEVKPRGGNLGIKVARHTFANIGKRLYIHDDILRELMGHERGDVDNYYKDLYPEASRDNAQMQIIG